MFDSQNRFVIQDYQNQPTFSSFLPGIAGEMGVPLWCYYNNRGQGVCSFGARDKDHAIMEFSPAHVAYREVSRTGFRTFCKLDGTYLELFTDNADMHIGMSELEITCTHSDLQASAVYFGIPDERTAALGRILTIEYTGQKEAQLELLDGMSAIVPYGLNQDFLKNMTQLSKAWMQCEDFEEGRAYFRVRASLEDSAIVREVKGGNFCLGFDENGKRLNPIVQPTLVFGRNTALDCAEMFRRNPLAALTEKHQITSNQVLCCFLPRIVHLQPGQIICIYSIYGQSESKEDVIRLADKAAGPDWFEHKRANARELTTSLTAPIQCRTGDPVFDAYARQTYLDNLLRGGAPMFFESEERTVPFHIYSRKHGDPEREYNYFSLGKEYFAQGNGNYRDVNQNRRCDVLFYPRIGAANIYTFFELIQTDGYNPLVILPRTYRLPPEKKTPDLEISAEICDILSGEFTPGQIAMAAENTGMNPVQAREYTARVICRSDSEPNASFGEGYWSDHWTYNLDLIESYLSVYPDRKEELLFAENTCRWYDTKVLVNPRSKRYTVTENGLRQYYALDEHSKQSTRKWMHCADGTEASSSLIEKILLLCALKTATLDAWGMGVEMEGGRPGWYDALNGLPGLLGSSMAESCELARLLSFAAEALMQHTEPILLYEETAGMLRTVFQIISNQPDPFLRWDALNCFKEAYREETKYGFKGTKTKVSCGELTAMLQIMEALVLSGIEKAETFGNGLIPTYFTYDAPEVSQTEHGPLPEKLVPTPLPLFLEGPVRWLKLPLSQEKKQAIADATANSGL